MHEVDISKYREEWGDALSYERKKHDCALLSVSIASDRSRFQGVNKKLEVDER